MSAKIVPTFGDRWCRVVSATDPHGHILGFLDRGRYFPIQVTAQLYSRVWVDSVPDPLLLRKSGRAGNRTRDLWICSQELWPLDHRGGCKHLQFYSFKINKLNIYSDKNYPEKQICLYKIQRTNIAPYKMFRGWKLCVLHALSVSRAEDTLAANNSPARSL
jgi:hypothetical protein